MYTDVHTYGNIDTNIICLSQFNNENAPFAINTTSLGISTTMFSVLHSIQQSSFSTSLLFRLQRVHPPFHHHFHSHTVSLSHVAFFISLYPSYLPLAPFFSRLFVDVMHIWLTHKPTTEYHVHHTIPHTKQHYSFEFFPADKMDIFCLHNLLS